MPFLLTKGKGIYCSKLIQRAFGESKNPFLRAVELPSLPSWWWFWPVPFPASVAFCFLDRRSAILDVGVPRGDCGPPLLSWDLCLNLWGAQGSAVLVTSGSVTHSYFKFFLNRFARVCQLKFCLMEPVTVLSFSVSVC